MSAGGEALGWAVFGVWAVFAICFALQTVVYIAEKLSGIYSNLMRRPVCRFSKEQMATIDQYMKMLKRSTDKLGKLREEK